MIESIQNKLAEISSTLDTVDKEALGPGILTGTAGLALFYFRYGIYLQEEDTIDKAVDCLSLTIQKINEGYDSPTHCDGIAGVGWALMHLVENDFVDLDCDALLMPMEEHLLTCGSQFFAAGNFDFLHGGIGIGLYFLKRLESTSDDQLKANYVAFLTQAVEDLKAHSISAPTDTGCYWHAYIDFVKGKLGVNLSLSHGISSILIFLAKLVNANIAVEQSKALMRESVDYLLTCKFDDQEHPNAYPSLIEEGIQPERYTRLAWCYGDLGLGLALYQAAQSLGDEALKAEAHRILLASTLRKDLEESGIIDAGICHGTCGLSLIYQSLHREFQEEAFAHAAEYWQQQSLTMDQHAEGYAGFMQWEGKKGWQKDAGILTGIAGIGMSFLSYLEPHVFHWEECLLIK